MAADLEGVVATSTRLSHVDGEAGRLTIAGYAVEDLAPYARFEEVAFLLLHARLPDPSELARFTQELAGRRALPRGGFDVLRAAAAAQAPPMDVLRMAAALLSLGRQENPLDDAMTAIACFPTIVGAYWRVRNGEAPVPVRPDLPHAAHYLQQVFGAEPSAGRSPRRQFRVLHGALAAWSGIPIRAVHADIRRGPRGGLVGTLPGATARGSVDPTAIGLCRADGPSLRSRNPSHAVPISHPPLVQTLRLGVRSTPFRALGQQPFGEVEALLHLAHLLPQPVHIGLKGRERFRRVERRCEVAPAEALPQALGP